MGSPRYLSNWSSWYPTESAYPWDISLHLKVSYCEVLIRTRPLKMDVHHCSLLRRVIILLLPLGFVEVDFLMDYTMLNHHFSTTIWGFFFQPPWRSKSKAMMLLEAGANQDQATDDGRTPLSLISKDFGRDFWGFPGLILLIVQKSGKNQLMWRNDPIICRV